MSTTTSMSRTRGLLSLVAAGLLWGTGGLTGTELAHVCGLPALAVAAFRLLTGGVLIIIARRIIAFRAFAPASRASWIRVIQLGLLAALFQGCYFIAVSLTDVTLATLVTIAGTPVIVQLAERAAGRTAGKPAERRTAVTTLLALAGLALLVGLPSGGYSEAATLASAATALLAAAGFATVTLLGASPLPAAIDDVTVAGYGFTCGGMLLLPMAAVTGHLTFTPTFPAITLLLALGVGPTALAYTLYFRGLRTVSPSTAAILSLLEPLTATVLAAILLGDRLTTPGLVGAVLLSAAVLSTVLAARR